MAKRAAYVLGLAGMGVAVIGIAARFLPIDNHAALIVSALSPYLMAAGAVAAVILGLARRWRTATAAALLTVVAVVVELPMFLGSGRPSGSTVAVRIATANLAEGQADPAFLAREIRDNADIVMLQELTPELARSLTREGLEADFPYRLTDARKGAAGVALWSRYPIKQPLRLPDYPLGLVTAAVRIPGVTHDTTVAVIHVAGPFPQPIDEWRDEMAQLPQTLARLADQAGPGAVIVAGDFNATADMAPFRKILGDGFHDAAEQAGAGLVSSFPADAQFPAVIGIDHVLTYNATASETRTFRMPGSDHLGLTALVHVPSG